MEYVDVDVYDIDGTDYVELKKIKFNNESYLVLGEEFNENNLLVQKLENDELIDVEENISIYILNKYIEAIKKEI